MKVLLVGVGGVGEAIAVTARTRPWLEKMVPVCEAFDAAPYLTKMTEFDLPYGILEMVSI
jgi:hypothetical protein